jgi:6,7-dimethyl-8-ribityllumazine synthase
MPKIIEGKIVAKGMRFGIVASRFNDFISGRLIEGAVDALTRAGADEKEIQIVRVPGAFELPLTAKKMAKSGRFDAVICLGAVIRGATPHFEYISAEVSKGIAMVDRGAGGIRRPDDGHDRTGDRKGRCEVRKQGLGRRDVRHRDG